MTFWYRDKLIRFLEWSAKLGFHPIFILFAVIGRVEMNEDISLMVSFHRAP